MTGRIVLAPRNVRTVTPALRKRALFLLGQAIDQERWVADHGGDLVGYVARYGAAADPGHYGDGGEAIHAADAAALERWWALYRALPAHVRAAVEAVDLRDHSLHEDRRLTTPALRLHHMAQWVDFCCHADMFGRGHAGYWATGVSFQSDDRSWGVFVVDEGHAPDEDVPSEDRCDEVAAMARSNTPLPPGWYVWGPTQWAAAYRYGERLWGERWYDRGETDATAYDTIMQIALLGEVRYG